MNTAPTSAPLPPACGPVRRLASPWRMGWLAAAIALAGCANIAPEKRLTAGQDEAAVLATMGQPTGRHTLPGNAGRRLEYARGPLGFETWMVDLDAAGKVSKVSQVLNQTQFDQVRRGMTEAELLRLLGRPAERQREFMDRETFYWRYNPYDCIWFAVTLSPQRRVLDAANGLPDPRCDASQ